MRAVTEILEMSGIYNGKSEAFAGGSSDRDPCAFFLRTILSSVYVSDIPELFIRVPLFPGLFTRVNSPGGVGTPNGARTIQNNGVIIYAIVFATVSASK